MMTIVKPHSPLPGTSSVKYPPGSVSESLRLFQTHNCKHALLHRLNVCNPLYLKNRVIRELEAQLEYEREKREKLEAQMDKLRAQIHTLTLQLEDERERHQTAVRILL